MSAYEDRVVKALLTVAARCGHVQRASFTSSPEARGEEFDEAEQIAWGHGFGPDRLIAMRSLARSRGVELADVLRAALRGDLRDVVALPETRARQ